MFVSPAGLRATCPTESVKAEEGGNATFQCRLVPSLDLVDHTIDWQREDVGDVVHVYRHKRDDPDSQAEHYRGRTTVDREDLRRGLLTLLISPVRLSDSGPYSCFVPALHTRCSINLIVGKLTSGWLWFCIFYTDVAVLLISSNFLQKRQHVQRVSQKYSVWKLTCLSC